MKHFIVALTTEWPDCKERGDGSIDVDITDSIHFALKMKGGPKSLIQWSRKQTTILNTCVSCLEPLNRLVLSTAHHPEAVRRIVPNIHVVQLTCLIEAAGWPDTLLPADVCFGFPLVGTHPVTNLFSPFPQPEASVFTATNITPVMQTNVEYTLELVQQVREPGL